MLKTPILAVCLIVAGMSAAGARESQAIRPAPAVTNTQIVRAPEPLEVTPTPFATSRTVETKASPGTITGGM